MTHTVTLSLVLPGFSGKSPVETHCNVKPGQRTGLIHPGGCDLKWASIAFIFPHIPSCFHGHGGGIPVSSCPGLAVTATLPGDSSARVLFSDVSVHPCRSNARDGRAGGISQIERNLIEEALFLSSASEKGW